MKWRASKWAPFVVSTGFKLIMSAVVEIFDMTKPLGKKRWAIAEGYIPAYGTGPEPQFTSHETFCVLNTGDEDAELSVTIYFTDRSPIGPYKLIVPAKRTRHFRYNELDNPEPIPKDTDYASVIESSIPVVVQHTRLDSRQSENALLTTIAYSE